MSLKKEVIDQIIKIEGGYVNDPSDSGGETNYGITVKVARENHYTGPMKDMPRYIAENIYSKRYWDSILGDKISLMSVPICEEIVDTAVNMGVSRASKFLQRSLNALNNQQEHYKDLLVDGNIGPGTEAALYCYLNLRGTEGEIVLARMLNCLQGAKYVELVERREKDEKYIYGWFLNRVRV